MLLKNRYGNNKTLPRVLRSACFSRKKKQENGKRIVKNYGGSKMLWIRVPYYFLGPSQSDAPKVTGPNLRFPAVFCENLRFPARICCFLRESCALQILEFSGEGVNRRKSAVFCENLHFGLSLSVTLVPSPKSGVAPANQTKERSVHELFAGAFRNKSSM